MASGIPTRRLTRRIDENAPPAQSTIATRSRTAGATTNGGSTAIPVVKRGASAPSASTTTEAKPTVAGAGKLATKRRAALGELPLAAPQAAKDGKKVAAERRPLASTSTTQGQQPLRRTTRVTATEEKTAVAATKRKAGTTSTTTTRRPGVTRGNSAISTASGSTTASNGATRPSRTALKQTASLTETGPSPKRFRPSPPPEDDVLVDRYDADAKEISVPKSPETAIVGIERRPKDFGWTDLDLEDEGDPSMVSEYVVDAFNYMLEMEKQTMPDPNYMDGQEELKWQMRAILNDWIIEVHAKFRLLPETLFIATNLIDRFLSLRMVSLVKFQLVGLTALFVAAKYEEVVCPSVTHFLHMTDGGYDVSEILRAERYLLQTLNFDLSYPNPLHFLRRVSKADGYDVHARTVAKFFIEISCVEHRLLPYPPSMLAAAAMWLARLCLDRGPWHANMVHYSEYAQHELLPCAQIMLDYVLDKNIDAQSAFFKKYASKKHLKASIFVRDWAIQRWPDSFEGESPVQGNELATEFPGEEEAPLPPPTTP